MSSFISWLDHSEEDQRQVREVLQLFSDKGTVDDLGIGTVRDAISNALFPGTSIIQTRARYFLFVPWIYRRAERDFPHRLIAKAADMERSLIEALLTADDKDGLIGRDAGKNVRTLPSAIFWGGLIRYGIFRAPSLSIRQYGRHAIRGVSAADVEDEVGDRIPSFWHRGLPDPPDDFFQFRKATFKVERTEAQWLCECMLASEDDYTKSSLLSAFIRDLQLGHLVPTADAVWSASLPHSTTEPIVRLVHHAERFSCAAWGAALLYNLILAEERATATSANDQTSPATYRHQLIQWTAEAKSLRLTEWAGSIQAFWNCLLDFGASPPEMTRRFISGWAKLIVADSGRIASSPAARELIRNREVQHKRGQARLANSSRLAEWSGNSGTTKLTFRWPQVQRMLRDIAAEANLSESRVHNAGA